MAQWAPWPIKTRSRHAPQNLSWRDVESGCEQFLDSWTGFAIRLSLTGDKIFFASSLACQWSSWAKSFRDFAVERKQM